MTRLATLVACAALGVARAQKAGTNKEEEHPKVTFSTCTKSGGCLTNSETMLTMDSQWRWLHDAQSGNCIKSNKWAVTAETCGTTCSMEGITKSDYQTTYGVSEAPGGIQLKYVNGQSVGSRLYMMEDESTYKMFKLLNKEFTFDVDVSTLECGLNGAVYFVEMAANGGLGEGSNMAGAKYGTGYCDAQCPHDLKFIGGQCNVKGWHMTKAGPIGHYGSCCSEMDIWEANALATAYTAHPCETMGPLRCEGDGEPNVCGDTPEDCTCCDTPEVCPCCGRYKGVCDRDGCDYNHFRLGNASFFGKGPQFAVDTSKPMTVVTQFITDDHTETGSLTEIRRLYVQNGKVIKNSAATNLGDVKADSITDEMCKAQKQTFGNTDDFTVKGGLRAMGESLKRGMVLVLSLWDDELTKMVWLDSATPATKPVTTPGVQRGTCPITSGNPSELRAQHPDASVTYANIRVGEIGTTYGDAAQKTAVAPAATPVMPATPGAMPAAPLAPGMAQPMPAAPMQQPAVAAPGAMPPAPMAPGAVQGGAVAPQPGAVAPGMAAPGTMPAQQPLRPMAAPGAPGVMAAPGMASPSAVTATALGTMVPGAVAPAAPLAPAAAGGKPVCCSSAKGADKCGSCWKGSALSEGFCASQANCGGCGGTWCPNGVTFAAAFEEHEEGPISDALEGRRVSPVALATWASAACLLAGVLGAAAWVRAGRRRSAAGVGEREALCEDGALPEAAA